DERPGLGVVVGDLEREIPDGATHLAAVRRHARAVLVEEREDALDRVAGPRPGPFHHPGPQELERMLEDSQEERILAREEVVEAPCVDFGLAQDRRDARGVIALLVEELERRFEDAPPR